MQVTKHLGVVASLLVSGCLFCCTGCGQPSVPTPPPAAAKQPKSATSAPLAVTGGVVTITLMDNGPEPKSLSVPADKDFTVKVINKGSKPFGFKFEGDFGRRTTEIDTIAPGGTGELNMNLGLGPYTATQVAKDGSEVTNRSVTFESMSTGAPSLAAPSASSSPSVSGPPASGSPAVSSPDKR